MRLLACSLLLFLALFSYVSSLLPDKFYGRFVLDHDDNLDEYMEAAGYGWFPHRLAMSGVIVEKTFTRGSGDAFDYEYMARREDNATEGGSVTYKGVHLGKEFIGKGINNASDYKITFYMMGKKLYEKHVPVNKGQGEEEEHFFYFDGPFLVQRVEAKGVVGKRFYKRVILPRYPLPDKFYGRFVLDHNDNFDEYLEAAGYGWFTRKLVTQTTFEHIFTKGTGKAFDYQTLSRRDSNIKTNLTYKGVHLGKEFIGEGHDNNQYKIMFWLVLDGNMYTEGDRLTVNYDPVKTDEGKYAEYVYYFDGQFLVERMEANRVVGKRFFKRVTV